MRVLLPLLLLCLCGPLTAQDQPPAQAVENIDAENLRQLVETLESETAREEFLGNLQALLAAQETQEVPAPPSPFRRLIDFGADGDHAFARFIARLNDLGLSDTLLSRLLGLLLLIVLLGLAITLNRRLARLLDRALNSVRDRLHLSPGRFTLYFRTQIAAGYVLALLVFIYAVNALFGFWLTYFSAEALLSIVFTSLLIFLVFVTLWEAANGLMEFVLGAADLPPSRQQTLLSVMRNFLMIVLVIMVGLMALSELGIDIVPLLAGAGIVGIALGFGAQTMVKDFLNGFIVIFEDLFQVGDVINVGGRGGVVEKITLRKVQLRNIEGTVHTVPFGEVAIIDNLTKEYAYYLLDIRVAYRENVDDVIACLRDIDKEMRAAPEFAGRIRAPLEVLGVEKFGDNAVVVRARTMTGSHDKWSVGREFNRRIKMAFDARGIEIPFPHRTIYFGEDRQGKAPPVRVELDPGGNPPQPRDDDTSQ